VTAPQTPASADYAAEAAFPPFDPTYFASQLFWLAISFALLYLLLSRFVLPRIGGAIEERRDRIADNLDAAADMKAQADETVKAYEKELADARARASAFAAEATREADAELDAKLEESDQRIKRSREKALAEVRTIAAGAASAVASHLAGLDVSEADAENAVDQARS